MSKDGRMVAFAFWIFCTCWYCECSLFAWENAFFYLINQRKATMQIDFADVDSLTDQPQNDLDATSQYCQNWYRISSDAQSICIFRVAHLLRERYMLTLNLKLRSAVNLSCGLGWWRNFEFVVNIFLSRSRWSTLYLRCAMLCCAISIPRWVHG